MMNTENRWVKRRVALVGLAVALAAALLLLAGLTKPSQAATGDILRTFNADPGNSCFFGVGVAFDGSELLTSCAMDTSRKSSRTITRFDPADGTKLGTYKISGMIEDGIEPEGIGALAWDAKNDQLWIGNANHGPERIYRVKLDKATGTGQATLAFNITRGSQSELVAGLAYEGTDDTLWYNSDGGETIHHYDLAGTLLGGIPNLDPDQGLYGSGTAVANAETLYKSKPLSGQIYTMKKDGSNFSPFASLPGKRTDDLECDNQTFSGKSALWIYSADSDELTAIEVPEGQCVQGGGVDPPPITCTFSEILPPVNDVSSATDAGMSSYKFGSRGVIPAKFQATCDNDLIDTQAEAESHPMTLKLTKLGSTPAQDTVVEQTQTGSANTGNLFQFVDADDHYIYNVGVKGLEARTYKLTISEANGGGSHDEWFSIK